MKWLRSSRNGQAPSTEYVILFAVVAAVAVSMTVYFRRAVQGRVRDSGIYMTNELVRRTGPYLEGPLYRQYEPYYINTVSIVTQDIRAEEYLLPGGSSGIYQRVYNETVGVDVASDTASPRYVNRTLY